MSNEAFNKFFNRLGVAFAALPLLLLLLFYAYVVRARMAVGHWPSYAHPESWSLGFNQHYALLRPWFYVFPVARLPFVIAFYDCALWAIFRRFPKWPFMALGVSSLVVCAWSFTDPGKFVVWFLD